MRILLYGKNAADLVPLATSLGLEVVESQPDVIISYGGDGTLLTAEQRFPGVPKLPLRDSKVCQKCAKHTNETLLNLLASNKLAKETHPKLKATIGQESIKGLNEVVVSNSLPIHAVRFRVLINQKPIEPNIIIPQVMNIDDVIIGDGVVAATPFGSTAYFQSITRQTIPTGFGLAFNNPTHPLAPLFFSETDVITVSVIRGPALVSVDNNPKIQTVNEGDITIKAAQETATIFAPDTLRCDDCTIAKDKRLT